MASDKNGFHDVAVALERAVLAGQKALGNTAMAAEANFQEAFVNELKEIGFQVYNQNSTAKKPEPQVDNAHGPPPSKKPKPDPKDVPIEKPTDTVVHEPLPSKPPSPGPGGKGPPEIAKTRKVTVFNAEHEAQYGADVCIEWKDGSSPSYTIFIQLKRLYNSWGHYCNSTGHLAVGSENDRWSKGQEGYMNMVYKSIAKTSYYGCFQLDQLNQAARQKNTLSAYLFFQPATNETNAKGTKPKLGIMPLNVFKEAINAFPAKSSDSFAWHETPLKKSFNWQVLDMAIKNSIDVTQSSAIEKWLTSDFNRPLVKL